MKALIVCLVFIIECGITGCQSSCNCQKQIEKPVVPDEVRNTRYIYSDMPAVITFDKFNEQLNQLACQLTVLYLIKEDDEYNSAMLKCMTYLQKKFFRYGVRILVIDLHSEINWPKLKKMLYNAQANYLAEYLDAEGKQLISNFLHYKNDVNNIFVIDSMNKSYIRHIYDRQCYKIAERIKSILLHRDISSNVSN